MIEFLFITNYQYKNISINQQALAGSKYEDDIKHSMSNDINQGNQKYPVTFKPSSFETPESKFARLKNNDCSPSTRPAMANRLLDWFSVVMGDAKYRRQYIKSKGK